MSDEPDASKLPQDWAEALARHGFGGDVDEIVAELYTGNPKVFPPRHQVFRAFHLTSLANVRVVILGQDPYPREGQANGLAFSVPEKVDVPRSLTTIYRNLRDDPALQIVEASHGDLSAWGRQGVLLLNTTLTVKEGAAGSAAHRKRWKLFTDSVLRAVNNEQDHVAFLLWGSSAIKKARTVSIDQQRHTMICSAHPAAWTAKNLPLFGESRPFSEANEFLKTNLGLPVNWDLTAAPNGHQLSDAKREL
ncbi:uracil-DNA glycosylase [Flexivirga endophytica]|uniref:Uracil-DNA glycosylase n=1 Tax=Flexivirga endophytica TaxID=1849103 RepID=A0A916SVJ2_9MICO|nr:uracil-DNA glycosylase [Flexivirga endophytica]GGB19076.1 uracil-DNA glycosylase [Flexivirga endophytica]GHB36580.1 uracil-DNA glycosylase [Flexivirga endophytica]